MVRRLINVFGQLLTNSFIHYTLLAALLFCALASIFTPSQLIVLFNGAFIGTMFAITIAYGELLWQAVTGRKRQYDDVRQMTIGMFGIWVAYGIVVSSSTYLIASDGNGQALLLSAMGRFVAIISAILQITAPNLSQPLFYGRDRKVLWVGVSCGIAVAICTIAIQTFQALALEGAL